MASLHQNLIALAIGPCFAGCRLSASEVIAHSPRAMKRAEREAPRSQTFADGRLTSERSPRVGSTNAATGHP